MGLFEKLGSVFGGSSSGSKTATAANSSPTVTSIGSAAAEGRHLTVRPGTKILIVDDSPEILVLLGGMLQSGGLVTTQAQNAEAGLAAAKANKPDLIFMDIVMPGMNGFAALRALRHDPNTQDVPVIMMSGNRDAAEKFFGSRIQADDFIKKPFSRQEVFARMERLLDSDRVLRRRPPAPVMVAANLLDQTIDPDQPT